MKKLLSGLEKMVEMKLIATDKSKNIYAGCEQYDTSMSNDPSTSYDTSQSFDYSLEHDL